MANTKNPSLDELKKNATSLTDEQPNIDDDDDVVIAEDEEVTVDKEEPEKTYNGPGVVIEGPIKKEADVRNVGPLANKDTQDGVEKSLRELDEQILEQHKKFLDITKNGKAVPDIDSDGKMLHNIIVSLPKNDIFSFFLLSKHKKTPPHGGASV
jgi:hypothetical protein